MNQKGKNSEELSVSLMGSDDTASMVNDHFNYPEEQTDFATNAGVTPNPFGASPYQESSQTTNKGSDLDASRKSYEENKQKLARYDSEIRFLNKELADQNAKNDPGFWTTQNRLKEVSQKRNKLLEEQENLAQLISFLDPNAPKMTPGGGQSGMMAPSQPGTAANQQKIDQLTAEVKRMREQEERRRRLRNEADAIWCCCLCLGALNNL